MSERFPNHLNSESEKRPEHSPEVQPAKERHETLHRRPSSEHLRRSETAERDIETIKSSIDREALTVREAASKAAEHANDKHQPTTPFVNAEIMKISYKRAMVRVRKQLSASDKILSYIIHQPVVDAISEFGSKTVARPSGVFGGGVMALIGTTIYYWIAKHYGYDYNFSIFLALVAAGFILGLSTEFLLKIRTLFRKSKN